MTVMIQLIFYKSQISFAASTHKCNDLIDRGRPFEFPEFSFNLHSNPIIQTLY